MNEEKKEKLKEQWHVRTVNMAQEVTDYSKVEGLIADWWLSKLDQTLTEKVASIRGELTELAEPYDKSKWHNNLSLKQVLSVPSLSLPASIEENE